MSSPRVSAIIVTRNNRRDIADALTSLRRSQLPVVETIVIDQSSTDGTADLVRRDFPDTVVVDFWDNPGFGEGNNRGFRIATGEYLFLLNPDAVAEPGCLSALVNALEQEPRRGIAVPKVSLMAEPSILNSAGLLMNQIGYAWDRGYLEWDAGQFDQPGDVLAGSGCALLIRTTLARALDGFDASYFMYYEDLDLCLRSWLTGHAVHYVPTAVVRHNMKVHARPVVYGEYYDHRNRFRTLAKAFSARSLARLAPRVATFEAKGLLDLARRKQWQALKLRASAAGWNIAHAASTLSRRREVQTSRVIDDEVLRAMMVAGDGVPRARAAIPTYPPVYGFSLDRSRLATTLEMGGNEAGGLGLGWHALESMDGRLCRWSCGYGILFLRAPAEDWSGMLSIQCRSLQPLDLVARAGTETSRSPLTGSQWDSVRVAATASDGVIRLELLPQTTFVPAETMSGSQDWRVLGVAVASVSAAD